MKQSPITHLAIILDGNRRWAKQHGILETAVYERAGTNIGDVLEAAFDEGIKCVSLWIGSYSNLVSRATAQVKALDSLYRKKFKELAEHPTVRAKKVRIEIIGEWRDLLSAKTVQAADDAMATTAKNTGPTLAILVGYDGVRERGAAVQAMLGKQLEEIPSTALEGEALLRRCAWSGHLPDVDLIIRTGVADDPHNSGGFYSFLTAESQYAFPDMLWPDFTADMLHTLCDDFAQRERRHGK